MKTGILYQLMTAFGAYRAAPTRPFAPPYEPALQPRHDPVGRVQPYARRGRRIYSEDEKTAVWNKAQPIMGWDPDEWRVDHRGNPLFRLHYRDPNSSFGWEIAAIVDPAAGGSDDLSNLRPSLCKPGGREEPHLGRAPNLNSSAR